MNLAVEHYEKTWQDILEDLRKDCGEYAFKNWFSKLKFSRISDYNAIITAPTSFVRDWVKVNYYDKILLLWQSRIKIQGVIFIVGKVLEDNTQKKVIELKRNRFSFENFIIDESNKIAYESCLKVAKGCNRGENPLILYGGIGLGKTHLMHAISSYIKDNQQKRSVLYYSAETYMYNFIKAIKDKKIVDFKENLRKIDVLMMDDIQFLVGKNSTQEEFLHTFNFLVENNKQIVIATNIKITELQINPNLKSRLLSGLIVDLHETSFTLRKMIINSKLKEMNKTIPQKSIDLLASFVTSNVRELEGALNKVIAYSDPLTIISAKKILDIPKKKDVDIDVIKKTVAHYFKVSLEDVNSGSKKKSVSIARQTAMFLCKEMTSMKLVDIAKNFFRKDHTTVIHAIQKVQNDRDLLSHISKIKDELC